MDRRRLQPSGNEAGNHRGFRARVQGLVATLEPGASYDLTVPAGHRLFAHVMSGRLDIGGTVLRTGQVGLSDAMQKFGDGHTLGKIGLRLGPEGKGDSRS